MKIPLLMNKDKEQKNEGDREQGQRDREKDREEFMLSRWEWYMIGLCSGVLATILAISFWSAI